MTELPVPDPVVVVAGAVVVHGRLLACRRVGGPDTAGGWELPGGKVEPGESEAQALVREVREELGCEIRPVHRLAGAIPLRPGSVLVAWVSELMSGEPVPVEHDVVRWLAPEELGDVTWLPADLPFVRQLEGALLDGEVLPGGNVGGAVRVGLTVRRPTGPWTPAVHDLLSHLHAHGLDGVPEVLGFDARGREVLTYLPGRAVDVDTEMAPDELLADAVRWLRRYHGAVAGHRPVGAPWRTSGGELLPGQLVCHNDTGAYNWVVQGGRFVGMIDWDMAGPGRPLDDLAFMAWSSLPLFRPMPPADVSRRLRVMATEYGGVEPVELLGAVDERMSAAARRITAGQHAGDPGMLSLLRVGEPARMLAALAALRTRTPAIRAALA
jgi:8-oxo-dGTP diphosphatase